MAWRVCAGHNTNSLVSREIENLKDSKASLSRRLKEVCAPCFLSSGIPQKTQTNIDVCVHKTTIRTGYMLSVCSSKHRDVMMRQVEAAKSEAEDRICDLEKVLKECKEHNAMLQSDVQVLDACCVMRCAAVVKHARTVHYANQGLLHLSPLNLSVHATMSAGVGCEWPDSEACACAADRRKNPVKLNTWRQS